MEQLCTQYSFQSSSMADSWVDSERKIANRSAESMREDETLGDEHGVTHKVEKFFDCPISWCSRRYRNPVILSKHISVVHQWRLKFSPKNGKNKSRDVIVSRNNTYCAKILLAAYVFILKFNSFLQWVLTLFLLLNSLTKANRLGYTHIARSNISGKLWKKRYICLFEGCKYRFWSRDNCEKHLLCHIGNQTNKTKSKGPIVNGSTENGRSQDVSKLFGMRKGKIVLNIKNGNREEHERNTYTPNSLDLDVMPEGHGQLSTNKKPYTVQTFLVREQISQSSSSTNSATAAVGVFDEMVAHLPVRNTVQEMVRVNVELVPAPLHISPILHL
ncbi:unnamed protein product [Brugia timori]|uniref:C2H2-type domain-containing protein n=1 Tax=Brugia timori TaxID=42155 RepID=A0A0R3QLG1_9BILA|nr:unnamed protein product [Brugia timori]